MKENKVTYNRYPTKINEPYRWKFSNALFLANKKICFYCSIWVLRLTKNKKIKWIKKEKISCSGKNTQMVIFGKRFFAKIAHTEKVDMIS